MNGRPGRGLTIVELLVVVAVVAALVAIIMPVLGRARETVRRSACRSNMRQAGMAIQMYRQDWDGNDAQVGVRLGHAQLGLPYDGVGTHLIYTTYSRDRRIWICPSAGNSSGTGTTYLAQFLASELMDPSRDWPGLAALRGPDYPLLVCTSHNGPEISQQQRASEDVMYYHVLRIDGRVDVRIMSLGEYAGSDLMESI